MRFIFKTDYGQDIQLIKHSGQAFWYGLLLLAMFGLHAGDAERNRPLDGSSLLVHHEIDIRTRSPAMGIVQFAFQPRIARKIGGHPHGGENPLRSAAPNDAALADGVDDHERMTGFVI